MEPAGIWHDSCSGACCLNTAAIIQRRSRWGRPLCKCLLTLQALGWTWRMKISSSSLRKTWTVSRKILWFHIFISAVHTDVHNRARCMSNVYRTHNRLMCLNSYLKNKYTVHWESLYMECWWLFSLLFPFGASCWTVLFVRPLKDNRKEILCPACGLFGQKFNYIIVSWLVTGAWVVHVYSLMSIPSTCLYGNMLFLMEGTDPLQTTVGIWDQIPPEWVSIHIQM